MSIRREAIAWDQRQNFTTGRLHDDGNLELYTVRFHVEVPRQQPPVRGSFPLARLAVAISTPWLQELNGQAWDLDDADNNIAQARYTWYPDEVRSPEGAYTLLGRKRQVSVEVSDIASGSYNPADYQDFATRAGEVALAAAQKFLESDFVPMPTTLAQES